MCVQVFRYESTCMVGVPSATDPRPNLLRQRFLLNLELADSLNWPVRLAPGIPLPLSPQGWVLCTQCCLAFYLGVGTLNSSAHAREAGTPATEPSAQPPTQLRKRVLSWCGLQSNGSPSMGRHVCQSGLLVPSILLEVSLFS